MKLTLSILVFCQFFLFSWQIEDVCHIKSSRTTCTEERTLIIIKPDGVQRGLIGEVLKRYEAKGLKLIGIKMMQPSRELIKIHYDDIKNAPYFENVLDHMTSGPIVITVWQGFEAVAYGRQLLGSSLTSNSLPGTIRFEFSVSEVQNVIHGADSVEAAQREIKLWFNNTELNPWEQANVQFIHAYD